MLPHCVINSWQFDFTAIVHRNIHACDQHAWEHLLLGSGLGSGLSGVPSTIARVEGVLCTISCIARVVAIALSHRRAVGRVRMTSIASVAFSCIARVTAIGTSICTISTAIASMCTSVAIASVATIPRVAIPIGGARVSIAAIVPVATIATIATIATVAAIACRGEVASLVASSVSMVWVAAVGTIVAPIVALQASSPEKVSVGSADLSVGILRGRSFRHVG